ncbi:MAG: hypothetical protein K6U03_07455, partial [Firmicutes bacterium]|nr:hypothetical protein [Bacillota bacterium]
IIFIPYGLLSGFVVLTAGFFAIKERKAKRLFLYLSAFLPLGMAASALYFAGKASHIIMPVFACLIALAASFISFLIIKNNTIKTT